MSSFEMIDVAIEPRGVAWLKLNRPDAKNAMSQPLMHELAAAAQGLAEDNAVRRDRADRCRRGVYAGGDLRGMTQQASNSARGGSTMPPSSLRRSRCSTRCPNRSLGGSMARRSAAGWG